MSDSIPDRTPRRVRHTLAFRNLEVAAVTRVTPNLVRVTLRGDELAGFHSPGFDDHVKVFFPDPVSGALTLPVAGPDGPVFPADQPRPAARDYTPRHYDPVAGTLDLDFAMHDAGPATTWAAQAKPGQRLGIGGPRGSFIIPTDFDAHLLIGDDTALPAIARRLAELPAGAHAVVLAEVDSAADQLSFESQAQVSLHWVHRLGAEPGSTTLLVDALATLPLPRGDYHAWIACESAMAKQLRSALLTGHGAHPAWTKAAGYWRRGSAASHDKHED